jgi:hypothetical protein
MKENLSPPQKIRPDSAKAVWLDIWQNPGQLVRHWNYKSALFSSTMRASLFLVTYLQFAKKGSEAQDTVALAFGAAAAQFIYRLLFAGINGCLIQAFRLVSPPWQALLSILIITAFSHLLEFAVQIAYATATNTHQHTDEAIVRSICVSIISAIFNLFAMRRGVMLVGDAEDRKTIWGDIKHIPTVVVEFVAFIPMEIYRMIDRGQHLAALLSVLGFGAFSAMVGWAIRGKYTWAMPWGIGAIVLMVFGIMLAALWSYRKRRISVSESNN